jgi:hypothetical protein
LGRLSLQGQGMNSVLYHLWEQTPGVFPWTYGYEEIAQSGLLPTLDVALLAEYVRHPNPLTAAKEFRQRLHERFGST